MVPAMTDSALNPKTPANFAETENKSLEPIATEAKDARTVAAASDTVKVTMLHHGDYDGKALLPGEDYDLPRNVAGPLVGAKRAELAD